MYVIMSRIKVGGNRWKNIIMILILGMMNVQWNDMVVYKDSCVRYEMGIKNVYMDYLLNEYIAW